MNDELEYDNSAAVSAALEAAFITKTLTDQLRELARARQTLADLRTIAEGIGMEIADLAISQKWHAARDKYREHERYIETLEVAVRNAAVEAFLATGDKHPAEGVTVKVFKNLSYAIETVTDWARLHMPMVLALDRKRFERAATSGILPDTAPVDVIDEPRVTIASDLSVYLEQTV